MTFSVSDKTVFAREISDLGFEDGAAVSAGIFDSDGKYAMQTEFRYVTTSLCVLQEMLGAILRVGKPKLMSREIQLGAKSNK